MASIDSKTITRRDFKSSIKVFAKVMPIQVWEHTCERTNDTMDLKIRTRIVESTYAARYYAKLLTVEELLVIFGMKIQRGLDCRATKGPVSAKRFCAVISSLSCDWSVLVPLLRSKWQACISPSEVCCVDELIMAYNVKGAQRDD